MHLPRHFFLEKKRHFELFYIKNFQVTKNMHKTITIFQI